MPNTGRARSVAQRMSARFTDGGRVIFDRDPKNSSLCSTANPANAKEMDSGFSPKEIKRGNTLPLQRQRAKVDAGTLQ